MPKQRDEDEAQIRQQIDKIVEGIGAKDLERLKQTYSTDVLSFDLEPPLQHVGIEAKLKNGTATSGMWVRGTFCFRKRDGNWLIAHDQFSVPLDIASGKGVTDLEP